MNDNLSSIIITSESKYKFETFRHWLKNKNNTSALQMLQFLLRPSRRTVANKYIKKIVRGNKYLKVYFRNVHTPLYCPKSMSMRFFYLVVGELFYPLHFHYYESHNTPVSKSDVVVDCGAGEGAFSLKVKDKCKYLYAIEPLPMYIDSLKKTFLESKSVRIMPYGLSDKKGYSMLTNQDVCSRLTDSEFESFKVKITTIDDLFYKRKIPVNYLKVDVEGSDLKVLKGAIRTIKKYRPKISVATYHVASHARKMAVLIKRIDPRYKIELVGIDQWSGNYVTLHAWID